MTMRGVGNGDAMMIFLKLVEEVKLRGKLIGMNEEFEVAELG